jgi:hypothetical protein
LAIRGVYGGFPKEILDRGKTLDDYGINAVWIGSDGLSPDLVKTLHSKGVKIFAEFNTMHVSGYLKDHPDASPVGVDGKICPASDGWQGICPTHQGYRIQRMDAYRKALKDFDIDGIWLDYHHSHASWEQAEPNMPDTCFCERCLTLFEKSTGILVRSPRPGDTAQTRLETAFARWVQWRCDIFTSWVKEFAAIRDEVRPKALLGTFHNPWATAERNGAIRTKLAIDLISQKPFIDVFSPMPYHARFGHSKDLGWIGKSITDLGIELGIKGTSDERVKIWPIVQLTEWGEPVPLDQIKSVLEEGARPPASGLTIFVWGALPKDWPKVETLGEFYRSQKP